MRAVVASTLDRETIVQKVTDTATELTHAEFGAFFYNVTDPESGDAYMLYTLSGVPREAFAKFPQPRATAVFAPTFHGDGPLRLDDVTADPRYGKSAPHFGMPPGHLPVRSYLAVPVKGIAGDVLGGLFFGHSQVGVFTEQHERLALGVASWAARLGDPMVTAAMLDRLLQRAAVLGIDGPSYRLRSHQARTADLHRAVTS